MLVLWKIWELVLKKVKDDDILILREALLDNKYNFLRNTPNYDKIKKKINMKEEQEAIVKKDDGQDKNEASIMRILNIITALI